LQRAIAQSKRSRMANSSRETIKAGGVAGFGQFIQRPDLPAGSEKPRRLNANKGPCPEKR